MSIERQKMLEHLKKQKEFLQDHVIPEQASQNNKRNSNEESDRDIASGKSTSKTLTLTNGKGSYMEEAPYNVFERKNGFTDACMLGLITFLCESFFLLISYFLFH